MMATNLELAKALAAFADALADLNHLPPLAYAVVDRAGTVLTRPYLDMFAPPDVGVRAVAEWAGLFGAPIELDLSDAAAGTVNVSVVVVVGGRRTQIKQGLLTGQYRTIERSLGIGFVEPGEQVSVTAQQLLPAVKEAA